MIYFIRCTVTGLVKIGYTSQETIADRLNQLKVGSPTKLEVIGAQQGSPSDERALHAFYGAKRSHGEWFRLTEEDLASEKLRPAEVVEAEWREEQERFLSQFPNGDHLTPEARHLRGIFAADLKARRKARRESIRAIEGERTTSPLDAERARRERIADAAIARWNDQRKKVGPR